MFYETLNEGFINKCNSFIKGNYYFIFVNKRPKVYIFIEFLLVIKYLLLDEVGY